MQNKFIKTRGLLAAVAVSGFATASFGSLAATSPALPAMPAPLRTFFGIRAESPKTITSPVRLTQASDLGVKATATVTATATATGTATATVTATHTATATVTSTPIATGTATATATVPPIPENPSIYVTTTADTVADDGVTSLREAIQTANTQSGQNSIRFDIPTTDTGYKDGVYIIRPTKSLVLTDPGTQIWGSSRYMEQGPMAPAVEIRGPGKFTADAPIGIAIQTSDCSLREMAINGFRCNVAITPGASNQTDNNSIQSCFIGLTADGTGTVPDTEQSATGILIESGHGNLIGGTWGVRGNFIAGNRENIALLSPVPNQQGSTAVEGNYIGVNSFYAPLPGTDESYGIKIASSQNSIGGDDYYALNVIYTPNDAITILPSDETNSYTGNKIGENLINSSGGYAIYYGTGDSGRVVAPNDDRDADLGSNNLQNFPIITRANEQGTGIFAEGTLNSNPNSRFDIDVYYNLAPSTSGHPQGEWYQGRQRIITDGAGNAKFSLLCSNVRGGNITCTATRLDTNDTSVFSPAFTTQPPLPVISVSDASTKEGGVAYFNLKLSRASTSPVSVKYTTLDSTAKAGSDYTPVSGTVQFAPGQTSESVSVGTIDDTKIERPESFKLRLSNPQHATLKQFNATGYINDNDTGLDQEAPAAVAITTPADGSFINSMPFIAGTARDNIGGSGIREVRVTIERVADHNYWTRGSWSAQKSDAERLWAEVLDAGDGSETWKVPTAGFTPKYLSNGKYSIVAYAYDYSGNMKRTNVTFQIDSTVPEIIIETPYDNEFKSAFPRIAGQAGDLGGSKLDRVDLTIRRNSDKLYWTGFGWGANTPLRTKLTPIDASYVNWERTSYLPRLGDLTSGDYTVSATVYDRAGSSAGTSVRVRIDAELPNIAITSLANKAVISELKSINGTASDAGGSELTAVELALRRHSDGLYWTGFGWGARTQLRAKPGSRNSLTNWIRNSYLPGKAALLPGNYTLAAYAIDGAGNSRGTSVTLKVVAPPTPPTPVPVGGKDAPRTDGPLAEAVASSVTLSIATASAQSDGITLIFTGPLASQSATAPERYTVAVNDEPCSVTSVQQINTTTVILTPDADLQAGDVVSISYNLLDSKGHLIRGITQVTVR
jgi:CSLREA domain-containing protein